MMRTLTASQMTNLRGSGLKMETLYLIFFSVFFPTYVKSAAVGLNLNLECHILHKLGVKRGCPTLYGFTYQAIYYVIFSFYTAFQSF